MMAIKSGIYAEKRVLKITVYLFVFQFIWDLTWKSEYDQNNPV